MATLTFTLVVGATAATREITPTNVRVLEFLDDMRNGPYLEDPVLSQEDVANLWINNLMDGQIAWAKGLRQAELDKAVTTADDLLGA